MVTTPVGKAAVIKTFGNISKYIREDGTLSPKWEEENIVRVTLPAPLTLAGTKTKVTKITCHKLIADVLLKVLTEIHAAGLWAEIDPYGGGFNFRMIRGSAENLSMHCWGIAWDFRPQQNKLGTKGTMHPKVIAIFEKHGFFWGGRFKGRRDDQHFQFAKGC